MAQNAGYTACACRDCMEIAIGEPGKAFCHGCESAGCEGDSECEATHAYCDGGEVEIDGKAYCEDCGQPF